MVKKELGIVICNFNKKEYLEDCIQSITNADLDNISYDIIVVDNASSDGSQTMVKENFPSVILIENKQNTGGSGGFATGMQYALDNQYPFICIQDNDTKVDKNVYKILKDTLENDSSLGVVGANILQMDKPNLIQEMGANIDTQKFKFTLNYVGHDLAHQDIPNKIYCDYVPACCLMTTHTALKQVGVFDINYFIYWDDIDWCTRVKNHGYKILALKNALVWHKGGAKLTTNTFSTYYFYRNKIRYFLKYLNEIQVQSFIEHIHTEFLNATFFQNMKKRYSGAITILSAFEDLYSNKLGKNDDNIFPKEEGIDYLKQFDNLKNEKIAIIVQEDIELSLRIVNYLNEFFSNITLVTSQNKMEQFSLLIKNCQLIELQKYHSKDFKITFCIKSQILDSITKDSILEDCYFIDNFFTILSTQELEKISLQYQGYKEIFTNIYQPIFEKKLHAIKKILSSK